MSIEHVADTALWVASHRAAENARPDALFQDPLAELLAGERGRAIAESMPGAPFMTWVMAIRTVAIDRLILQAIQHGVDAVLNIGAGLDTRPYRMSVPPTLRWIEADFPSMIEYKTERLGDARPVCHLERIGLDLADADARRELLARAGREGERVLVITEGVLPYLSNAAVAELADDLYRVPQIQYWIQDYYNNGGLRSTVTRLWQDKMRAAPIRFHVENWFPFFAERGWRVKENVTMVEESRRVGRRFPFVFPTTLLMIFRLVMMSPSRRKRAERASGYAMLERTVQG